MGVIRKIGEWLDARLQLAGTIRETAEHRVPETRPVGLRLRKRRVSRLHHANCYRHFPRDCLRAFRRRSLQQPGNAGSFDRFRLVVRVYMAWLNSMVAIVLIHMVQVFLFGAYKFPRELTWIVGVFLLLMTLGMAFSGQVLRFDQDAFWGLGIGASISSRVPVVGPWTVHLLLGGPIIAGATLSRFFALHVF